MQRMAELAIAKPWMVLMRQGGHLYLEAEEWRNKSSGRGSIRLILLDEQGSEQVLRDWPVVHLGSTPYEKLLPGLFPWADFSADDDAYIEHDREQYETECLIWGTDDNEAPMYSAKFSDWRAARFSHAIRSVVTSDETAYWRLEMRLNQLGLGFLEVEDYLDKQEH